MMNQTDLQGFLESKLAGILDLLEVEAVITVDIDQQEEDRSYFTVDLQVEEGGPELIGKYGRILEALNTILNAAVSSQEAEGSWRVVLDINGYRKERSEYIEQIAERAINKVLEDQKPYDLAPMKPWERRIIHSIVSDHPEVGSRSEGQGPSRHVVIELLDQMIDTF